MSLNRPNSAWASLRLMHLVSVLFLTFTSHQSHGQSAPIYPAWWANQGVLSGTTPNDYAAANLGQAKNMATGAISELNSDPVQFGGAGDTLNALATALSATTSLTNDYAAINLGQLKTLVQPFYDRLLGFGYIGVPLDTGTYPWLNNGLAANDYAMANLGQLKYLFSFNIGPVVPTNVTGTMNADGSETITWQNNGINSPIYLYLLSASGTWTVSGTLPAGTTSYTAPPSSAGSVGIRNNNSPGGSNGSPGGTGDGSSILAPPAQPTRFCAVVQDQIAAESGDNADINYGNIQLQWDPVTDPSVTELLIEKKVSTGPWQQLRRLASEETACNDSGLLANQNNYYRITAINDSVSPSLFSASSLTNYNVPFITAISAHSAAQTYGDKVGWAQFGPAVSATYYLSLEEVVTGASDSTESVDPPVYDQDLGQLTFSGTYKSTGAADGSVTTGTPDPVVLFPYQPMYNGWEGTTTGTSGTSAWGTNSSPLSVNDYPFSYVSPTLQEDQSSPPSPPGVYATQELSQPYPTDQFVADVYNDMPDFPDDFYDAYLSPEKGSCNWFESWGYLAYWNDLNRWFIPWTAGRELSSSEAHLEVTKVQYKFQTSASAPYSINWFDVFIPDYPDAYPSNSDAPGEQPDYPATLLCGPLVPPMVVHQYTLSGGSAASTSTLAEIDPSKRSDGNGTYYIAFGPQFQVFDPTTGVLLDPAEKTQPGLTGSGIGTVVMQLPEPYVANETYTFTWQGDGVTVLLVGPAGAVPIQSGYEMPVEDMQYEYSQLAVIVDLAKLGGPFGGITVTAADAYGWPMGSDMVSTLLPVEPSAPVIYMFSGHDSDTVTLDVADIPGCNYEWRLKDSGGAQGQFQNSEESDWNDTGTTSTVTFRAGQDGTPNIAGDTRAQASGSNTIQLLISGTVCWEKPLQVIQIQPRSSWGALAANTTIMSGMSGINQLTVHHSSREAFGTAEILRIQKEHMGLLNGSGWFNRHPHPTWGDIGYHFILDPSNDSDPNTVLLYEGRQLEGLALTGGQYTVPSAVLNKNTLSGIDICVLGNYQTGSFSSWMKGDETFSELRREKLEKVLAALSFRYKTPPANGTPVYPPATPPISYHQQLAQQPPVYETTECPGNTVISTMSTTQPKVQNDLK